MATPKASDKLMKHLMQTDRVKLNAHESTENAEYINLKYDMDRGVNLLPHKMKRFLELKEKLGK